MSINYAVKLAVICYEREYDKTNQDQKVSSKNTNLSLLNRSDQSLVDTKMSNDMSLRMRKPTICIGENKGADQLRSNCEADQHLCFYYTDSTIPLLSISSL